MQGQLGHAPGHNPQLKMAGLKQGQEAHEWAAWFKHVARYLAGTSRLRTVIKDIQGSSRGDGVYNNIGMHDVQRELAKRLETIRREVNDLEMYADKWKHR